VDELFYSLSYSPPPTVLVFLLRYNDLGLVFCSFFIALSIRPEMFASQDMEFLIFSLRANLLCIGIFQDLGFIYASLPNHRESFLFLSRVSCFSAPSARLLIFSPRFVSTDQNIFSKYDSLQFHID
jgi:hypothetical protein